MAGSFHVLGCKSLMPGCNGSVEMGKASGPCPLQAGLVAAGKQLGSAILTKAVFDFVGLGFFVF